MTLTTSSWTFHYPAEFDDRAEYEMTLKGYLSGGSVEFPDGRRYPVTFFDPVRLTQDVELIGGTGVPVLAEPGLVVIPEITRDAITRTIPELVRQQFFDHLKPLPAVASNGIPC